MNTRNFFLLKILPRAVFLAVSFAPALAAFGAWTAADTINARLVAEGVRGDSCAQRFANATPAQLATAVRTICIYYAYDAPEFIEAVMTLRADGAAIAPALVSAVISGASASKMPARDVATTATNAAMCAAALAKVKLATAGEAAICMSLKAITAAAVQSARVPADAAAAVSAGLCAMPGVTCGQQAVIAAAVLNALPKTAQSPCVAAVVNAAAAAVCSDNEKAAFAMILLKNCPVSLVCDIAVASAQLNGGVTDKCAFVRAIIAGMPSSACAVSRAVAQLGISDCVAFAATVAANGTGIDDAARAQIAAGVAAADPAHALQIASRLAQLCALQPARNAIAQAVATAVAGNATCVSAIATAFAGGSPGLLASANDFSLTALATAIAKGAASNPAASAAAVAAIGQRLADQSFAARANFISAIAQSLAASSASVAAVANAGALFFNEADRPAFARAIAGRALTYEAKAAIAAGFVMADGTHAIQIAGDIAAMVPVNQPAGRAAILAAVAQVLASDPAKVTGVINAIAPAAAATSTARAAFAGLVAKATPAIADLLATALLAGETTVANKYSIVGAIVKNLGTNDAKILDVLATGTPASLDDKIAFTRGIATVSPLSAQLVARAIAQTLTSDADRALFAVAASAKLPIGDKIIAGAAQTFSNPALVPALAQTLAADRTRSATGIAAALAAAVPAQAANTAAALASTVTSAAAKGLIASAAAAAMPGAAAQIAAGIAQQSDDAISKATVVANVLKSMAGNGVAVLAVLNATTPAANADRQIFSKTIAGLTPSVAGAVVSHVAPMFVADGGDLVAFTGSVLSASASSASQIAAAAAQLLPDADRPAFVAQLSAGIVSTLANVKAMVAAGVARVSPANAARIAAEAAATITSGIPAAIDAAKINVALAVSNAVPGHSYDIAAAVAPQIQTPANYATLAGWLASSVVAAKPGDAAGQLGALAARVTEVARATLAADDSLLVNITRAVVQAKPDIAYDVVQSVASAANSASLNSALISAFENNPIAGVPKGAVAGAIAALANGGGPPPGPINGQETCVTNG